MLSSRLENCFPGLAVRLARYLSGHGTFFVGEGRSAGRTSLYVISDLRFPRLGSPATVTNKTMRESARDLAYKTAHVLAKNTKGSFAIGQGQQQTLSPQGREAFSRAIKRYWDQLDLSENYELEELKTGLSEEEPALSKTANMAEAIEICAKVLALLIVQQTVKAAENYYKAVLRNRAVKVVSIGADAQEDSLGLSLDFKLSDGKSDGRIQLVRIDNNWMDICLDIRKFGLTINLSGGDFPPFTQASQTSLDRLRCL